MATVAIEERELLKSLRWWDGFVVALANPGFLIGSLGFSIGSLGGWGAMLLWGVSMFLGTLQNWIYAKQQGGGVELRHRKQRPECRQRNRREHDASPDVAGDHHRRAPYAIEQRAGEQREKQERQALKRHEQAHLEWARVQPKDRCSGQRLLKTSCRNPGAFRSKSSRPCRRRADRLRGSRYRSGLTNMDRPAVF